MHGQRTDVLSALALAALVSVTHAETRTWRSKKGTEIKAELVRRAGTAVYLRTADGRQLKVFTAALSLEDQRYLVSLKRAGSNGGQAGVSMPEPEPLPVDYPWPVGKITEPVPVAGQDKWSYRLYLPKAFSLNRTWPVLFVMSPGGGKNARTLQRYVKGAEWNGWVLAMSVESRNGFDGAGEAMESMVRDVQNRLPVDTEQLYSSGFSGGSRMAFMLAGRHKPALAGVLACGAGRSGQEMPGRTAVYGLCGSNCFNRWDMACTHRDLKNDDNRLKFFVGKHAWGGEALLRDGMTHLYLCSLASVRCTDRTAVAMREVVARKLYDDIAGAVETNVERAYEWAVFLADYKAAPAVQRDAQALLTQLKKQPAVQQYAAALKEADRFVEHHFATDVMDYVNNNGTKAAARDGERLAEEFKDTGLADLFRHMGQKAATP